MPATVRKWGNSLGIRIPKALAQQADLAEGTPVEFEASGGQLTIRAQRKHRRRIKLSDLLKRIKGPNPHRRLMSDGPRGREMI